MFSCRLLALPPPPPPPPRPSPAPPPPFPTPTRNTEQKLESAAGVLTAGALFLALMSFYC